MSLTIKIHQDSIKLTKQRIVELVKCGYGTVNFSMTLDPGVLSDGNSCVIYDTDYPGHGFEVKVNAENDIVFTLFYPATSKDVNLLFKLIRAICKEIEVNAVMFNDETIYADQKNDMANMKKKIMDGSKDALSKMIDRLVKGEVDHYTVFCCLNPVVISKKEVEYINDINKWQQYIFARQKDNYGAEKLYKREAEDTLFALFFIQESQEIILPKKPANNYYRDIDVQGYYMYLPSDNIIPYSDFIENVTYEYYDVTHIKVVVDYEKIIELGQYNVNPSNNEPKPANKYRGTIYDDNSHQQKILKKNLPIDQQNGYSHIAIYLRWLLEHNMVNENYSYIKQEADLRDVLIMDEKFHGRLQGEHLNSLGREFSNMYYRYFNTKTYKEIVGNFPEDVDRCAEEYFTTEVFNSEKFQDEAYLFMEYNEEYYQLLSKYIDIAFEKFKTEKLKTILNNL